MDKKKLERLNQVDKQIQETSHAITLIDKHFTFLRLEARGPQEHEAYGSFDLADEDENNKVKETVKAVLQERLDRLKKEFNEG